MKAIARDYLDRYYAERIWEMIPGIYRHEDGIGEAPGTLRAIVEVLAEQAAILRRSQDRLWEDQFIAWCEDWAVPYLADMVGARLLSNLNKRGRRADVAKTIYYRRRKGTLRVLEELISDISGWEGKVIENFRRLARARHALDPIPTPLAGRFSGTMPGGTADLRHPRISELAMGAFSEFFYTPDMRRHRGHDGRYGIPKLAIHLYRLVPYRLEGVTPFSLGDNQRYTFDPSGRDIPLFARSELKEKLKNDYQTGGLHWEQWHSAREWETPAPIRCRLLGHAEYLLNEQSVRVLVQNHGLSASAADDLRMILHQQFPNEKRFRSVLISLASHAELLAPANYTLLLRHAIVRDCGKQGLLPNGFDLEQAASLSSLHVDSDYDGGVITSENCTAANLKDWLGRASNKLLAIDPERGRFVFAEADPDRENLEVAFYYGFSGEIGAGAYPRPHVEQMTATRVPKSGGGAISASDLDNRGVAIIEDNKTYGPISNKLSIENLIFLAASNQRPFVRLEQSWILSTGTNENSELTLDGLWIGAKGDASCEIILRGNYECVTIRHCTLDPGGGVNALKEELHPIELVIEGFVEQLCIINSITGPIFTRGAGGLVNRVSIADSIVQSVDSDKAAIQLSNGVLEMERVTVFGEIDVIKLFASEVILCGEGNVKDAQSGCFRFSAAPEQSRLPHPYESFLFETDFTSWFTAKVFGHPGFAQLSDVVPTQMLRGAENGSEMGAFSSLINPIKLDDLRTKIEEYMPFGLIPVFINET